MVMPSIPEACPRRAAPCRCARALANVRLILVACGCAVGPLGEGFLPHRVKQRAMHDRRLLTWQDLILVFDLADIEVVAQQVVQRAAPERDPAARRVPVVGLSYRPSIPLTLCTIKVKLEARVVTLEHCL